MNFETTEKIDFYLPKVKKFINEHVLPIELKIRAQNIEGEKRWEPHPEIEGLKKEAQKHQKETKERNKTKNQQKEVKERRKCKK